MTTKKQVLKWLKHEWSAAKISITYKAGVLNNDPILKQEEAFHIIRSVWNSDLISLQEQFMCFFLNRANKLIGYRLLNTDSMLQCPIDIKLLVCLALHCMATSVIIAHNHPSGPLKPSIKDEEMTKKIRLALELIDVKFIDYFVISDKEYLSFQNEGLM